MLKNGALREAAGLSLALGVRLPGELKQGNRMVRDRGLVVRDSWRIRTGVGGVVTELLAGGGGGGQSTAPEACG